MRVLGVLLLGVLVVGSARAEVSPSLVSPYLKVQIALAVDSLEGVTEAARALAAAAAAVGGEAAAVVDPAEALADTDSLDSARTAFGPVSDAFIAYGQAVGLGDLKVAFCPMANKSWVQQGGAIANPFYGSRMLTCGVFRQ